MNTPATYFIFGMGVQLLFVLCYKLLRRKWVMISATIISLIMALIAFNHQGIEDLQLKNGYTANWFYSPGIFLMTFTFFRFLFKLIFKNEPILAGAYQISWEQGEYRKLHFGDSLFTVLIIILPMAIPIFL